MLSKLSKTITSAVAVVLVAAPLGLAQQSGSSSSGMGTGAGSADRPGASSGMSGSETTGSGTTGMPSPSMGTIANQTAIPATVAAVNHQKHTVKLQMQGGETVELKVPEQSLASLSKGDSVQVSIHKAAGQSGMPSSPQSRPESGAGTTGSTGTRSR